MKFICGAITEQCSNRMHINQDKFGAVRTLNADDREIILALVCDGVSIAYHSEYASYHTVLRLLRWAEQYFPNTNGFDIQKFREENGLSEEDYSNEFLLIKCKECNWDKTKIIKSIFK